MVLLEVFGSLTSGIGVVGMIILILFILVAGVFIIGKIAGFSLTGLTAGLL